MIIAKDYSSIPIPSEASEDLSSIAGLTLEELDQASISNLLVFPDALSPDLRDKIVCSIRSEGDGVQHLLTNSIVGFIGKNDTCLSIHSRFTEETEEDYFLHYMLCKTAGINLVNLGHDLKINTAFDFLPYLFPSYLKKALSQGVIKQYITRKANDAKIKGPPDVSRHIRQNILFSGKIAYSYREFSHDNYMTQLVRHTVEHIGKSVMGKRIIEGDPETRNVVRYIRYLTPDYTPYDRDKILSRNFKYRPHPYFSAYLPLQKLCLQILRHDHLKYGLSNERIYGILIDAAWLWEEYLATVLKDRFKHYLKDSRQKFYLFDNNIQQIIPDYVAYDDNDSPVAVADAKYIPLDRRKDYWDEKATAIYYKTVTYMHRFQTAKAYLMYPVSEGTASGQDEEIYAIGVPKGKEFGGEIIKIGLRIPGNCDSFSKFVTAMRQREDDFMKGVKKHLLK